MAPLLVRLRRRRMLQFNFKRVRKIPLLAEWKAMHAFVLRYGSLVASKPS